MAELNPIPSTADKIEWNTNPTNPETDPAAQRAAGWAVNEVPDAQEFNFVQTMIGNFFVWLQAYLAREWRDIGEAGPIVDMDVGARLAVVPPVGGANARGSAVFSGVVSGASGGGNIYHLCTDGEFGYYVSGGGGAAQLSVVQFDMSDGSVIQQAAPLGANEISALAVDGAAVFMTSDNVAKPGLNRFTRAGLSGGTAAGSEYDCTRLVCNGYHAAGVAPNSGAGKVVVWSDINGTIAEDGAYDTSSAMSVVAIDAENTYIGGTRATYDVWAVVLSTQALNWQTTLPTTTAPTVYGLAADGDRVYVATNLKTLDATGLLTSLSATGNANLYCLDRMDGVVLWSADIGSGSIDLDFGLSIDDKYLYAADGTTAFQIDKRGAVVQHMAVGTGVIYENTADGVSLLTTGATIATFSRFWTQAQTRKVFVRTDPTDPWRMPFHHIVNPD